MKNRQIQLSTLLDHDNLRAVRREVVQLLAKWYDKATCARVDEQIRNTYRLYRGKMRGFRACNTDYHNLRHTVDVLVAGVRLVDGWNLSSPQTIPADLAFQLCVAALFHDAGYIQESWDTEGTGAKYTRVHVRRSVEFLGDNADRLGIEPALLPGIQNMVWGTDLALEWDELQFASVLEHEAACILASADLLGQMADRAYLEKLLFLYYEFREAAFSGYATAYDILRNTAGFYESTRRRMDTVLRKRYELARPHFERRIGYPGNLYMESIDRQISYLAGIVADSSSNFRTKLKRMDFEQVEARHA